MTQKTWLVGWGPIGDGSTVLKPCRHASPFPKTLPPIKKQQSFDPPTSWNIKTPKEETSWPCPQPPSPSLLYLGLTARAHAIDYYLANFFFDFPRHFLYR